MRKLLLVLLILPLSALAADRGEVCFYSSVYKKVDRTFRAGVLATIFLNPQGLAGLQVFKAVELESVEEVEGTPLAEMLETEQAVLAYRETEADGRTVLRTQIHAKQLGKNHGPISVILGAGMNWEPVPEVRAQFDVKAIYGWHTRLQEKGAGDDRSCFLPL